MRKKFFLVLSVLVCALCCALGLAGCDLGNSESGNTGNSSNNGSNHTHSYQWVDNGDGTHKQHCSKTGCDAPDKNKESHVWDKNNKCQKCDAENSGIVIKECLHTDSLWHVTDSKESTCEKPGYTLDIYVCKGTVNEGKGERMCGKVFADENAAKTDTFIGILDEKQFDSKNCFNVYRKTLPLSDHTPVTDAAVPATCTQKGLTEGSHCSVCKEALKAQQETDFADHSYTSSVTLQETVLSKYNVCSVCGKVENKDVKYSARLNDDEKSYTIVSITGSEIGATLYVPKSYNDKPVIAIGEQACYNDDCAKITNANIPEGIELIGDFAFTNCGSLSEVTIPRSVTSIGKYAFYGCHGITEIAIPQSITRIEEYTFYECSNLKKVEIAESVSYVSYLAFSECPIETATIPAGIISAIKNSALRSVEIISGDRIGSYAFSGCINLASITLPESVIKLDYSSFESCDNLTVIRYMGNLANWCEISGLEYLMKSNRTLLINGAELTGELVIPKGVTQISSYAFSGCNKIVSVEIPDSVTDVGYGAFYNCPIESAKIPAIACPVISNSALKTVEITSGKTIPDN
ncbi:MAG: leucine-rich repeat domain-containing protein, partial [Clostridia bacterium]|nr:leucine-rich repeat domain-containing protein [Clostridia bacterium]